MEISLFKFKFKLKNKQEQYNELLFNPKEYLDKKKKALRGIKVKNVITFRHVKITSLLNFAKQLAALIQAGFSIKRGLDLLVAQQDQDMEFKTVLSLILYNLVSEGKSLSASMSLFPEVFPLLCIHIIFSGEQQGNMPGALKQLSDVLDKNFSLYSKIKAALTYPTFIVITAFLTVFVGMRLILPYFTPFLSTLKEVPLPTKVLLFSLKITSGPAAVLSWITVFSLLIYIISNFLKTENGKIFLDNLKLNIPIYGNIYKKQIIIQFCQTLANLSKSGVAIMRNLKVSIEGIDNVMVKEQLIKSKFLLENGETLSDSLKAVDIFPDLMLDMIAVGAQTGELSFTLEKISSFYSLELEYILEQFTALLEPIVITILGAVIGFIVLGIFLPIYSMLKM